MGGPLRGRPSPPTHNLSLHIRVLDLGQVSVRPSGLFATYSQALAKMPSQFYITNIILLLIQD